MIDERTKQLALARLNRIEGQVRGLKGMVETERYCIDIIQQVNAARRALEQVALLVMKRHLASCVSEAIQEDKSAAKIEEFILSVDKFIR
ncbi:MAG: metal-sensitive transcriptional regulator [Nitrospinota bacterium]